MNLRRLSRRKPAAGSELDRVGGTTSLAAQRCFMIQAAVPLRGEVSDCRSRGHALSQQRAVGAASAKRRVGSPGKTQRRPARSRPCATGSRGRWRRRGQPDRVQSCAPRTRHTAGAAAVRHEPRRRLREPVQSCAPRQEASCVAPDSQSSRTATSSWSPTPPPCSRAPLRRGLVAEACGSAGPLPDAPAVIELDRSGELVSASSSADPLLAELSGSTPETGARSPAIHALASATRTAIGAGGRAPHQILPSATVKTPAGTWLVLHGGLLGDPRSGSVAVFIQRAHPTLVAPLLLKAYCLTPREQEVTQLMLRGATTIQAAQRLETSPHTITDHMKSIFEKRRAGLMLLDQRVCEPGA